MGLTRKPPLRVPETAPPHRPKRPTQGEATIVQQLVKLRKARGLSQTQLARKIGVTQPAIAKIEALRVKHLRLDTVSRAAQALGASLRLHLGSAKPGTPKGGK